MTYFRDLAAQKGVSRPIWLTEFGWSTYSGGGVSETTQATWTRDAVKRAIVDWGSFVELVFVYQWDRTAAAARRELRPPPRRRQLEAGVDDAREPHRRDRGHDAAAGGTHAARR